MQKLPNNHQSGFAHVLLIVVALVVLGAVGFVGFRAFIKDRSAGSSIDDRAASLAASLDCMKQYNDRDLCKFLSSWNVNEKFKLESTTTTDGKTNKSIMTIDGDSSYMKMDGEFAMEVITISDTTYTKGGDTWWKQTAQKADDLDVAPSKDDFKFDEPQEDSEEKNLTTYTKEGKEACGSLTCFKYKVVDPENADTTEYIWFDDKEYLVRRILSETKDGTKNESVFSYDNISVKVPSPVKDLGPNQYIMPGQTEPQTMADGPSEAELQELMKQYAQ